MRGFFTSIATTARHCIEGFYIVLDATSRRIERTRFGAALFRIVGDTVDEIYRVAREFLR